MYDEGTVTAQTRCWAQGMDGWRPMHLIPQLKWLLCATGSPIMNDTDLAITCLNMMIRICEFYPNRWVYIVDVIVLQIIFIKFFGVLFSLFLRYLFVFRVSSGFGQVYWQNFKRKILCFLQRKVKKVHSMFIFSSVLIT